MKLKLIWNKINSQHWSHELRLNLLENFREWQQLSLIWYLPAPMISEFTLSPLMLFMHFGVSLSFPLLVKVLLSFAFCCQIHPFPSLSSWFFSFVFVFMGERFFISPSGFPVSFRLCVFLFLEFSYSADTLIHSDLHSAGRASVFGSRAKQFQHRHSFVTSLYLSDTLVFN